MTVSNDVASVLMRINEPRTCIFTGCKRPTIGKGFCSKHYQQQTYSGGFGEQRAIAARLAARRRGLLRWHNMTLEEFDELLASQGGVCAVCGGQPPPGKGRDGSQWHVDHDHGCCSDVKSCGKCTRGILCPPCNRKLTQVEDKGWFRKAQAYLAGWNAPRLF